LVLNKLFILFLLKKGGMNRQQPKRGYFLPFLLCLMLLISSCASKKDILYLQDYERIASMTTDNFEPLVIRPNDILLINVASFDMEAAAPFNLVQPARNLAQARTATSRDAQGFIVNTDGTIEFPVLGTVMAGGKTRQELVNHLKTEISAYLKDPIINIEITNYKITVLGEVNSPGTYSVRDERITLLEALGYAGDMNIYGKRNNILVIREENGVRNYSVVDITNSNFVQSPFYYLKQNDVVYVQPNNPQIQASAYNRNSSVYLSIVSLIITLTVLITR
jgi:polysaccharide export outer membrane protein